MMPYFEDFIRLEENILRTWDSERNDPNGFSKISTWCLRGWKPNKGLAGYLVDHFLKRTPETTKFLGFTTIWPYVRLIENSSFSIELLFWEKGTTAIHDHMFKGAFRVFTGKTRHVSYEFSSNTELSPGILQGELFRKEDRILDDQETLEIPFGNQYIHHTTHLAKTTVTVIVISKEPHSQLGYCYHYPGLRFFPPLLEKGLSALVQKMDGEVKAGLKDFNLLKNTIFSEMEKSSILYLYSILSGSNQPKIESDLVKSAFGSSLIQYMKTANPILTNCALRHISYMREYSGFQAV